MNGSNKVQILSGSSTQSTLITKLPNNLSNTETSDTQLLLNSSVKHNTEEDYQIVPNTQILDNTNKEHTAQDSVQLVPNNHVIEPEQTPNYMLSQKGKYLEIDNYFSEYDTKEKKRIARKNLGIEGFAEWGNIEGYVEDQKDLVDYIQDKIDTVQDQLDEVESKVDEVDSQINDYIFKEVIPLVEQLETDIDGLDETINQVTSDLDNKVNVEIDTETQASKQIQYSLKNSDLKLNSDFNNALNAVLGGNDIKSIDDAISILLHKMFPVTYTDWSVNISNTATKSYSIEKGTKQTITPSSELGTITINITPGNKGDTPVSLTVNGTNILQSGKNSYSISVKFSDLVNQTKIDTSYEKTYQIILTTTSKTIQKSTKASINVSTFQYYFFDTGVNPVTNITSQAVKQTSNEYLFDMGDIEKFISIFSPKQVTTVEGKGGETANSLDTAWRTLQEYTVSTTYYTPTNGTSQKYYRITLNTPQARCLKIKVT